MSRTIDLETVADFHITADRLPASAGGGLVLTLDAQDTTEAEIFAKLGAVLGCEVGRKRVRKAKPAAKRGRPKKAAIDPAASPEPKAETPAE